MRDQVKQIASSAQNDRAGSWRDRLRNSLTLILLTGLPPVGLAIGPSYAPICFSLAILVGLSAGQWPRIDRTLAMLGSLFLALCAIELIWSITLADSAARIGQLAAIWVGCLLLLSLGDRLELPRQRFLRFITISMMFAALLLLLDRLAGYPLQALLTHGAANGATKYNRGLVAMVLIFWPIAEGLTELGWRRAALGLSLSLLLAVLVGLSSTGLASLLAGGLVWLLARWHTKVTAWLIGLATILPVLALPFCLRLATDARASLAGFIKPSGLHRLEIWDYMSARILERPWQGWGLGAAKAVPIRAEELANYVYVSKDGIYPHNQWLELWLETGLPGVLLGLALLVCLLLRSRSPFALAAIAAALTASSLNFEITTDSWWAALAVTGLLFRLVDGRQNQLLTRKI